MIIELCRHEIIRERRSLHFSRNILIWILKLVLWINISLNLALELGENTLSWQVVVALLGVDQFLRWTTQSTPTLRSEHYKLIPIKQRDVRIAYMARLIFLPLNFIWLPVVWPHWWMLILFILNGYIYAACWIWTQKLLGRGDQHSYVSKLLRNSTPLMCDFKLRMRHPALRSKIRNSFFGALMLIVMSCFLREETYTNFVVLYTLTFPTLPLSTSRLGYEQAHISLLKTRMHSLRPIYWAKYQAAILLLIPCAMLLLIPVALNVLSLAQLSFWILIVALIIYPILIRWSPMSEISSPTSQIITLSVLTLPILINKIIKLFL